MWTSAAAWDAFGHASLVPFGPVPVTTFLLIRHALCDPVGTSIAGRAAGIHLNPAGRVQAAALAQRIAHLHISAIYSSPLERALETAEPMAVDRRMEVVRTTGLNEVDFGEWTGRSLAELNGMADWREFNVHKSATRIPKGETMTEVLARAWKELDRIRRDRGRTLVAVVSHGNVLRSIVTHALGASLDFMHRLVIDPASVTILAFEHDVPRLLLLNSAGEWPEEVTSAKP